MKTDYGTKSLAPTTPLPATNPQWQRQTQQIPYYECKGNLSGLSLCYSSIDYSVNQHPGIVPDAIAISNLHLPEIQKDHQARFNRPFNKVIPYVYGPGPQIKWVNIDINGSMPKNLVFLSVQREKGYV